MYSLVMVGAETALAFILMHMLQSSQYITLRVFRVLDTIPERMATDATDRCGVTKAYFSLSKVKNG